MKKILITIKESIFNRVTFKTIVAATFLIIIGAVCSSLVSENIANTIYWPIITSAIVLIIDKSEIEYTEKKQKKKNTLHTNTIPQKLIKDNLKLSNKLSNLEKENKVLHDEINDIKQQNEEIIKLLKESNQKNDCVISRIAKKIKK